MRHLWASFNFFVDFLIIFFIVQSFKNYISLKILDIQKYNIVRYWFSPKNWIFAIFLKKVSIDCFLYFSWNILFFLLSKVSKMKFYKKTLIYNNTTLYDIDFPQKIGFLRFFLRTYESFIFFVLTVLITFYFKVQIFHRKYTPNFEKIDFFIYPNILYIFDQNFMIVSTLKL